MKKRIIIVIAAMVILCGVLTGIGILMSVQKPEKKSEQKSEKVEQELQTKLEEKQKNPKQETPETQESKEQQKTEEEPLSMELSGLNEDALSMMGISKKEVADALRTWTQEHGFSSATGAQFWSRCWYDFQKKNTLWIASLSLQMAEMEFSRRMYKQN